MMKTNQILISFRHAMALVALALALYLATSPARAIPDPLINTIRFAAQSERLIDPKELEAFLAPLMTDLMESNHIPGGAIAVVKDDQLFFAQGYGYADLERRIPATADTTGLTIAGLLGLVSSAGILLMLPYIAGTWWQRALSLEDRLHYTLTAVAALYFVWYLNEVNLFLFWF